VIGSSHPSVSPLLHGWCGIGIALGSNDIPGTESISTDSGSLCSDSGVGPSSSVIVDGLNVPIGIVSADDVDTDDVEKEDADTEAAATTAFLALFFFVDLAFLVLFFADLAFAFLVDLAFALATTFFLVVFFFFWLFSSSFLFLFSWAPFEVEWM
jgi:hypothetical protein